MKKEELPQDKSALEGFTKELCYVQNEDGTYSTDLSQGWEIKKAALDNAWEDIHEKVELAGKAVKNGEKSPVYYFMIKRLMNEQILSAYTGLMKFRVKRHFSPKRFHKLSDQILEKYANAFEISVEELKQFKGE